MDESVKPLPPPDKLPRKQSGYSSPPWKTSSTNKTDESSQNQSEVRVTHSTGGQKGSKLERFDLLPWDCLQEVARLYGKGAEKYEERNWERGYPMSLSFAALQRHLVAFWQGESHDKETGCHHLASVVFHAFALMRFEKMSPTLDTRPAPTASDEPKSSYGSLVPPPSQLANGVSGIKTPGSSASGSRPGVVPCEFISERHHFTAWRDGEPGRRERYCKVCGAEEWKMSVAK